MVTSGEGVRKRARNETAKQARRQDILDTAWSMLDDKDVANLSVAEIAKNAGLAKGTIYLYFHSKEEIFLALLEARLNQWLHQITAYLEKTDLSMSDLAQGLCEFVAANPKFMGLACSSNAILEQNVSRETAILFKRRLAAALAKVGNQAERVFPQLEEGKGTRLLLHSYALILGMWQLAEPPEMIKDVLACEELSLFQVDFQEQAVEAIINLWEGMTDARTRLGSKRPDKDRVPGSVQKIPAGGPSSHGS